MIGFPIVISIIISFYQNRINHTVSFDTAYQRI